ncbi:unnamed protein product [Callosobruchus maculatus]|uniref:ZAD domain-containing protein n=1 Tax=Callosobruchus maculatus TaxID=64391 RepID=A0A653CJK4_CALMS|nr:unnamed protein product [Callosobruchus maculatus]
MSLFCFVPNCKNTAVIPFPKDSNSAERSWKLFKVHVPSSSSFLCVEHYNDIRRYQDGKGPCNLHSPGKSEIGSVITTEFASNSNEMNELSFIQQNHSEIYGRVNDSTNKLVDSKDDVCDQQNNVEQAHRDISKHITYDTDKKIKDINQQQSSTGILCESQLDDACNDRMVESGHQSCKANNGDYDKHNLYESNFNYFENGYIVYERDKIMGTSDNHLSFSPSPNVQSVIDDTNTILPDEMEDSFMEVLPDKSDKCEKCRLCMKKEADTKDVFSDCLANVPIYLAIESCFSPIQISRTDKLSKRICFKCWVQLLSYYKFRDTVLKNDRIQRKLGDEIDDSRKRENDSLLPLPKKIKIGETYLKKISGKNNIKPLNIRNQTVASNENNRIEEELQKVLRNNLPEEQASAENIILHVQNDSEFHRTKTVLIDVISNPIQSMTIITGDGTVKKCMVTPAQTSIMSEKVMAIRREIKAAKSENKNVSSSCKSLVGVFETQRVTYIFDTEFCLLDGYLFEYRLHKPNSRNLKCILPTCQATAVQQKLRPNTYSTEAKVTVPHNHEKASEADKKKQMFFSIMRRKLQSDKGINFKNIYETACAKDPFIRALVPLKSVLQEVCHNHAKCEPIYSFEKLAVDIEQDYMYKLQFTLTGKQFYQNQFTADDSRAIVFANLDIVEELSSSKLMYVDASFKIDCSDNFQLVTILIWLNDSYYPAIFVLINKKTQGIYKKVFQYIHDMLAPKLRPDEIVTDYEANLYYALGEIYVESCIGGSVFYYTQNLYKKICALDLCKALETDSYFRNVYHMLLMLPLLPVNTISDGLNNLELQSKEMKLFELMKPLFEHVRTEWMEKVTPDLFCVHRLENRINENVMAPFRKLRDLLVFSKGKSVKPSTSLVHVVEKIIELENYLQVVYSDPSKKYFARDLSSTQKKNVLKAWHFIESHPKININTFFTKVLGYIKCMENQLWIWGFYRYEGDFDEELISSSNFSIVANEPVADTDVGISGGEAIVCPKVEGNSPDIDQQDSQVVVEGVIDIDGSFVLHDTEDKGPPMQNTLLEYVCDT